MTYDFPFRNPDLPLAERVTDLLSRLTPAEKAAQLMHEAPALPHLGIPAYNWWNECLHGVARAGTATVFPQAIGLAASFDVELMAEVAGVIADEARAKHHAFAQEGDHGYYKGLTFWSPNINIFRDPRWGRGHETYGECPYLTARLGVAFVRGLQGDHPRYLKLAATAKHFAVHSGPEALRHGFDARASRKDLFETYLPAFAALVREAGVESVMTAYNRVNGAPASASEWLLAELLRGAWGFQGHVVSDCGALDDLHLHHATSPGPVEAAADALRAGCDLNCGCTYQHLPAALASDLIDESVLDTSLTRLLRTRLRLGMFDPEERVPFARMPLEIVDSPAHRRLSRRAAQASLVLLKNDGVLPLSPDLKSLAVIGPNANVTETLWANYAGTASRTVTVLDGVRARLSPSTTLYYAEGCRVRGTDTTSCAPEGNLSEAVMLARRADVTLLVLGLNADLEGEQPDAASVSHGGDKPDLELPGLQQQLLEAVLAVGKPVVLVLVSGSALTLRGEEAHVAALLQAFYPGQEGGSAIADVLFGDVSPAGRLPVTFPRSALDLPDLTDYAMRGRTYRYAEAPALFPFGFGLSYTRFAYSELSLSQQKLAIAPDAGLTVGVTVKNLGARASDEVVQLYVQSSIAGLTLPHFELRGMRRIHLAPGASQRVELRLDAAALSFIDEAGQRRLEPSGITLYVGGSQPDARSLELCGEAPLSAELVLEGSPLTLAY